MLPSNHGADALAALLSGDENFSGKLPFTYSKHINALHTYDYKVSEHRETMEGSYNYDAVMDVQWPFGFGLSYTEFAYSNLRLEGASEFAAGDELKVSVDVTNTGKRAGKEAVLLYSSDLVASLIPDVKRLRGFEKIALEPGETKTVGKEDGRQVIVSLTARSREMEDRAAAIPAAVGARAACSRLTPASVPELFATLDELIATLE